MGTAEKGRVGRPTVDGATDLVTVTHRVTRDQRDALDVLAEEFGVDRAVVLRAVLGLVSECHAPTVTAAAERLKGLKCTKKPKGS